MKKNKTVQEYMDELDHPLKKEINEVRRLICEASPKITERIKWNAPSYYYKEDLVTFNHRNQQKVHLVFHHIAITGISSCLLEGTYKDRRMLYFSSMSDIHEKANELNTIINALVKEMDLL